MHCLPLKYIDLSKVAKHFWFFLGSWKTIVAWTVFLDIACLFVLLTLQVGLIVSQTKVDMVFFTQTIL